MTDAWKRRLFAIVALLVAAGALGALSMSNMEEATVYYWSPTELKSKPEALNATVRLGGMVEPGTMEFDRDNQVLTFTITDGTESVAVRSTKSPPQMFREGIGVIVEGKLQGDGTFATDKLMVKHSNEYEAPTEGEHDPKVIYKSLVEEAK